MSQRCYQHPETWPVCKRRPAARIIPHLPPAALLGQWAFCYPLVVGGGDGSMDRVSLLSVSNRIAGWIGYNWGACCSFTTCGGLLDFCTYNPFTLNLFTLCGSELLQLSKLSPKHFCPLLNYFLNSLSANWQSQHPCNKSISYLASVCEEGCLYADW